MADHIAEASAKDEIIARIARRCRHFNGLAHRRCKAHLAYADVVGRTVLRDNGHVPCIGRHAEDCGISCVARSPFTLEEATRYYNREDLIAVHYFMALRRARETREPQEAAL